MELLAARIGKPHGLRGEVTVRLHTDSPRDRFVPGAVFATDPPGSGPLTLLSARVHQGGWLLSFAEARDRTAAEALRGTRLLLDAGATAAEPDAWYESELVGLAVDDPAGTRIGEVVALHDRPAQDLLEVRLRDGRCGLVPFVADLVPLVDVPGGVVVVDAPDGLFDLD